MQYWNSSEKLVSCSIYVCKPCDTQNMRVTHEYNEYTEVTFSHLNSYIQVKFFGAYADAVVLVS